MKGRFRPSSSMLAAAVLAVLTLAVFALSQNRGPESTVLRYLEALDRGDVNRIGALTATPIEAPASMLLANQVQALIRASDRIQIAGSESDGRRATVVAVFINQRYGMVTIPFALTKPSNTWLVDPVQTQAQIRQMISQGRG